MMNLNIANSWKSIPVVQGVGVVVGGNDALKGFNASLVGKELDLRDQIRATLDDLRKKRR